MSLTRKDVHVEMKLIDGSLLKGTLVIDRTSRLSDSLNNHEKDFIVLLDYDSTCHIINKRQIIKVLEVESLELE